MSLRPALIATACAILVAAAGCSSSIAGTAQAADLGARAPIAATGQPSGPGADDALTLPTDGTVPPATNGSGAAVDPSDLLGALNGLGGTDSTDPSKLAELLGSLGAGHSDLGDLGGMLNQECLTLAGAAMSLSMILMLPAMGAPLTSTDVDKALASLKDVPPELAGAVATLRQAAHTAVGQSPSDAAQLLSDPSVAGAMDDITTYMDAHCGTAN